MVTTASTLCTTCQMVGAIDNGHVAFLPSSCQLTCGCVRMQWPGVQGLKDPPHAQLPLFGGAAFERCMAEFQTAVTSLSFPNGKTPITTGIPL